MIKDSRINLESHWKIIFNNFNIIIDQIAVILPTSCFANDQFANVLGQFANAALAKPLVGKTKTKT